MRDADDHTDRQHTEGMNVICIHYERDSCAIYTASHPVLLGDVPPLWCSGLAHVTW